MSIAITVDAHMCLDVRMLVKKARNLKKWCASDSKIMKSTNRWLHSLFYDNQWWCVQIDSTTWSLVDVVVEVGRIIENKWKVLSYTLLMFCWPLCVSRLGYVWVYRGEVETLLE